MNFTRLWAVLIAIEYSAIAWFGILVPILYYLRNPSDVPLELAVALLSVLTFVVVLIAAPITFKKLCARIGRSKAWHRTLIAAAVAPISGVLTASFFGWILRFILPFAEIALPVVGLLLPFCVVSRQTGVRTPRL